MSNYYFARLTHATTGVKTRTPGFQPKWARITIAAKGSTPQMWIQRTAGKTDGTNHFSETMYGDTSSGLTSFNGINHLVSQWDKVSGIWTEVCRAEFDSFTATEFKYNVTVAGSSAASFTYIIECGD
jgi:hypothetical protein